MSGATDRPDGPAPESESDEPDRPDVVDQAARRRRRAAVFGESLPESTGDERADWGERAREGGSEEWLRAQVPPHHG